MLSRTWNEKRHDKSLRVNLFRSLARIFLKLASLPLPRIGSFIIDHDGFLNLTNRPLSLEIQDLENEDIPINISRKLTYPAVESYVTDILAYHESRVQHQHNAFNSLADGLHQMAAITTMKAILPHFFLHEFRQGPFVFSFTDLHQSNFFVDDQWRITRLLDLEWAFSRPIEMLHPPYWLTNQSVDGIEPKDYEKLHQEFLDAPVEEEAEFPAQHQNLPLLSRIISQGWDRGTFWYSLALDFPTGLFGLFYDHIQPLFAKEHLNDPSFFGIMKSYWSVDADSFIQAKVKDKEDYDLQLGQAFGLDLEEI